ncbi:hypothetical protein A2U01_0026306, partial [Trifolium medium]|nr:hypothetical protein [Trifolium medium]
MSGGAEDNKKVKKIVAQFDEIAAEALKKKMEVEALKNKTSSKASSSNSSNMEKYGVEYGRKLQEYMAEGTEVKRKYKDGEISQQVFQNDMKAAGDKSNEQQMPVGEYDMDYGIKLAEYMEDYNEVETQYEEGEIRSEKQS